MTQFLPPNLLALFAPRDPIPYLPPLEKLPHEKHHNQPYSGIAPYIREFEDPRDAPPPTRAETREERMERKRREKIERRQQEVESELKLWDPHNDPNAQGDAFKTLFVARVNYDTTESKLRREFEVYGPIKRIYMVYNKRSGKPRGYAFIEYEHERDMHCEYPQTPPRTPKIPQPPPLRMSDPPPHTWGTPWPPRAGRQVSTGAGPAATGRWPSEAAGGQSCWWSGVQVAKATCGQGTGGQGTGGQGYLWARYRWPRLPVVKVQVVKDPGGQGYWWPKLPVVKITGGQDTGGQGSRCTRYRWPRLLVAKGPGGPGLPVVKVQVPKATSGQGLRWPRLLVAKVTGGPGLAVVKVQVAKATSGQGDKWKGLRWPKTIGWPDYRWTGLPVVKGTGGQIDR
ncbi:heterogeneous nuclear ribonucleoprotein A1-like isoform X1 [Serinus canaria]|uniref:heterogeneous nuclear ribonucleoprotein A1-like isoform X1 n=1 Tax=Serinus canaria TaxID=9135 RepID=UPI0021CD0D48|nr:heterogeneous nuclear ribonucleoprotein A1-like isoform X1 [Serinus canaria]